MKSLRKVKFYNKDPLKYLEETMLTDEPTQEKTKERIGLFHEWGKRIIPDFENGKTYEIPLAIIEELSSGKV